MSEKEQRLVLFSTGLPIVLGIFLFVINPRYMMYLVRPGPVQPFGWLMVVIVCVLTGVAYLVQRTILNWANSRESSSHITIGKVILLICSVLFLVLPAVLLLILGPALLIMTEAYL